jgi:monoamine oxidase
MNTIIIIGGGICGLAIAKELLDQGKKVTIIEAKERTGGRIRTEHNKFSTAVDAGAEFIHGDLPLTKSLLQQAGIPTIQRDGKIYKNTDGKIKTSRDFTGDLQPILEELHKLSDDVPLTEFLSQHDFPAEAKSAAIRFAEGFDAADSKRISSFSVRGEWSSQKEEDTWQVKDGHERVVEYLTAYCLSRGCEMLLNVVVNEVHWQKNNVILTCTTGKKYRAEGVVITVPLGVLLAGPGEKGNLQFFPPLPDIKAAARLIGFGTVIKVVLEFQTTFWSDKKFRKEVAQLDEIDFFITENYFPTWWANADKDIPILTGWIGGPKAGQLKEVPDELVLTKAIDSLAQSLLTTSNFLREQLKTWAVYNWGADPFSKGAYSYNTVESSKAKAILSTPIEGTVFFAGEAINDGESVGTVESALSSAEQTIEKLIKQEM